MSMMRRGVICRWRDLPFVKSSGLVLQRYMEVMLPMTDNRVPDLAYSLDYTALYKYGICNGAADRQIVA